MINEEGLPEIPAGLLHLYQNSILLKVVRILMKICREMTLLTCLSSQGCFSAGYYRSMSVPALHRKVCLFQLLQEHFPALRSDGQALPAASPPDRHCSEHPDFDLND